MVKNVRIVGQFDDPKNRCTEYEITFTARVYHNNVDRTAVNYCKEALSLLMVDPRRSESFPVFQ